MALRRLLVNHTARLFAAGLQERIKPLGLTIGPFPVLLEIWVRDGVTQRELLEKLALEQAILANTLSHNEREQFLDLMRRIIGGAPGG